MAVLDPKNLRVPAGGALRPTACGESVVLQPADLARSTGVSAIARGGLPLPQSGWTCDLAEWFCEHTANYIPGHDSACSYAKSASCRPPKPPAPPPPVYSQVSGKECDSQESPTAKELGLCDEELCNLAAMLDMWSFAPGTDWTKCYVEPNGDSMACRLKCPGAKKALAIGGAGGANGGGPPGCGQHVGPPGCDDKCCFRYMGGPLKCYAGYSPEGCAGLAAVQTSGGVKPYADISYDCLSPHCRGGG